MMEWFLQLNTFHFWIIITLHLFEILVGKHVFTCSDDFKVKSHMLQKVAIVGGFSLAPQAQVF